MIAAVEFDVVIPARFASTRLPGKALIDIAGKPMIQHVYEQASRSNARQVIIATDDERIRAAAATFGAPVTMTSADHQSGTDRLQEAVSQLGLESTAIVVNVQGDEPLIPPALINQVAAILDADASAGIATLCEAIDDVSTFLDPAAVKVVFDQTGSAHYFSRAPIPWPRDAFGVSKAELPDGLPAFRHIGIYAYRVAMLQQFVQWPLGELEQVENLEQLRALQHGVRIHVAEACESMPGGVDTEQDLARVQAVLERGGP